ncbi:class I SAM-dependent methyltransferase [Streptomyces harbinensis]|uniref:class I SAM-dependent methyltransferase n=1 Tax=Streptomyces harbinensis TaxID=1176198 RepID=UPI0034DE9294
MTAAEIAPDILAYYDERTDEDTRLSRTADGALELVRTREILRRHLPPPPATVLDVGGGTGIHARWLAAEGYAVHVVDPVPRHVARAARVPGCTAERGDARALPEATVYGVEGPGWAMLRAVEVHTGTPVTDSPLFTAALEAARFADGYPDLLAASSHLLAVAGGPAQEG